MEIPQRSSGVLLHITSLPGPHGIGDFGPAAYKFVDWLASAGQSLWQWLPTTPIGPGNSPYQSVSAFAGSPLMVALEPLVESGWLIDPQVANEEFLSTKVEFDKVVPWRINQLRAAWQGFKNNSTADQNLAMKLWAQSQSMWLDDYALFMALEVNHQGKPWWEWTPELRSRKLAALANARLIHSDEIGFWTFVQWCFDVQMSKLRSYANSRDIAIIADVPIFIAHHSADCWARPDLYYLDDNYQPTVVAGVPPDGFGPDGQRWGNPLYRWGKMEAESFKWWVQRVQRSLMQADIFRIDHFRGFAGYYEIPASCPTAREGQWVPAPGMKLFAAIEAALGKLPIIAEDLGLMTPDVIELRDHFQFPGMRILQFGFGSDAANEFLPHNYAPNCVTYSGTHDNDTARGWWDGTNERERAYAGTYLAANASDIHWAMIRAASNSVAKMAIFPLQDVLGLDRSHIMNRPGTATGNWEWRFEWSMINSEASRVLGVISAASGRSPMSFLRLPS
jgi:4-alpha-glucanotransferase